MSEGSMLVLDRPGVATIGAPVASEPLRTLQEQSVVTSVLPLARLPDEMMLGSLGDRRLRVLVPIHVLVSTENDDYIAHADEVDEFGFGSSYMDAVRDLQRAMVELYLTLSTEAALGPEMQRTLKVLRTKLAERP